MLSLTAWNRDRDVVRDLVCVGLIRPFGGASGQVSGIILSNDKQAGAIMLLPVILFRGDLYFLASDGSFTDFL